MTQSRNNEITKGSGNGLQPHVPFQILAGWDATTEFHKGKERQGKFMAAAALPTKFAVSLIDEGWRTPYTYANHYDEFPEAPGVYLFMKVVSLLSDNPGKYKIMYVGKSRNLSKRIRGHEMYPLIRASMRDLDVLQKWFKPLPERQISEEEVRLIKRFNPPFNIIHRVRGQ